jgi:26S proteasome regulatory subunit N2
MEQLLRSQGQARASPFGVPEAQGPGGYGSADVGSGAAAAAGVLTAVDEDGEGDEEAAVPNPFEYFSDGEDEEE